MLALDSFEDFLASNAQRGEFVSCCMKLKCTGAQNHGHVIVENILVFSTLLS